jgi:HK97 family phage prohead protease
METRTLELFKLETLEPLELRAAEGDKPARLNGYAAVFNAEADLRAFVEKITPGAFARSIGSGKDIRALVDHDPAKILGRTSAGTLRLGENDRGLWVSVDMPDTSYARDLMASVKRGDIRGMSFGFSIPKGGDSFAKGPDGRTIRTLNQIDLVEVTATSVPAYGATSLSVRVDPTLTERMKAAEIFPRLEMVKRRLALSY